MGATPLICFRVKQKQGMNYKVAKVGVQDLWSESLDKTIDNRHNKAKMVWGDHIEPIKNYRKHSNYKPKLTWALFFSKIVI